jgi:ABC-type hemin transport system substrate-binding protein
VPAAPGARLYTVAPTRIAEIEMTIVEIAAIIGTPARAPDVVDSIQKPIESVLAAVIDQPRPTVHVALAGAWIPDMVAMAGGAPVAAGEADLVVIAEGDPPPGGRRIVAVDPGYYAVAGPRVAYGIVQLGFLLHPTRLVDPQLPLTEVIP